jgi:hypothetical protein
VIGEVCRRVGVSAWRGEAQVGRGSARAGASRFAVPYRDTPMNSSPGSFHDALPESSYFRFWG